MPFRILRGLLVLGPALLVGTARLAAEEPLPSLLGTTERFVSDRNSALALGGNDPVTYLVEAAARAGLPSLETAWSGVVWRFASAANRAAFAADPDAFAPRLGGYDAFMAGRGVIVAGDPAIFRIRSGRLYLFRSEPNRQAFDADPALATEAETRWTVLRDALAQD